MIKNILKDGTIANLDGQIVTEPSIYQIFKNINEEKRNEEKEDEE